MKVKTADLIGPALDWAVAKAEGFNVEPWFKEKRGWLRDNRFSKDWSLAGPIIERECMDILCLAGGDDGWQADKYLHTEQVIRFGPTPLVAAMRCLVASKLGDEVDVPDELV